MKRFFSTTILFAYIFSVGVSPPSPQKESGSPFDEHQIAMLINQYRHQEQYCGSQHFSPAEKLEENRKLRQAAQLHSEDMSRHSSLNHRGSAGETTADRLRQVGYHWRTFGENIAVGQTTEEQLVESWMNSEGHCKNIMNPKFKEMGFSKSGKYATLVLGSPMN